jgi:hypothetical protein
MMGIFTTLMWALPHGNRKLSLPKWVILPLSLTLVILYSAIRYSMYLFSPLCTAPSGPTRWGSSSFGALFLLGFPPALSGSLSIPLAEGR